MNDLKELEKEILEFYLKKGFKVGSVDCGFIVQIVSLWKNKELKVSFYDGKISDFATIEFITIGLDIESMYEKAFEHFKSTKKDS